MRSTKKTIEKKTRRIPRVVGGSVRRKQKATRVVENSDNSVD
jgi:hypothetical protein